MQQHITLSQIGLYNPQRVDDKLSKELFVVRNKEFDYLMERISSEQKGSIPQHHLIIGQRGMGKTTLLKRIEVELRQEGYRQKFVPLLFPEEQYNLKNLAELWLNSLDALADTLEVEGYSKETDKIDKKVDELDSNKQLKPDDLAKEAFMFIQEITESIGRRPVLLIDNINIILGRLDIPEQYQLRAWITENNAPIIIGASTRQVDDVVNYKAPFYDAFQVHYLKKLSTDELVEMMINLARLTQSEDVIPSIHAELARLKTLNILTGGNPRTAVMLFKLIVKGFSRDINDDLEGLLDEATPLYKARFEELSPQMQIIVDAVAMHWHPINMEQLRSETRYESNQLSPQLKRLVDWGWIEKVDTSKAKNNTYQICERFFNIWFLMRRNTRRKKRDIYCLSRFLETFYGDELETVAKKHLLSKSTKSDHLSYGFAVADAVCDEELKKQLLDKTYKELFDLAKTNPDILNQFEVPDEILIDNKMDEINKQFYSGNHERVDRLLDEVISLENNQEQISILYSLKGINYSKIDELDKSEDAYKKAIQLDGNNPRNWYNLGVLYQTQLDKPLESETAYKKAIELDSEKASYWFELGKLYQFELDKPLESEDAYKKAIDLDNKNTKYWSCLGSLYHFYLDKLDDAIELHEKVIKFDNKNMVSLVSLALLYESHVHNYKIAEETWKRALDIEPDEPYIWRNLGNLYLNSILDYQKAEEAYRKSIELDDKNVTAKINQVFLLRDKMGKLEEAEKLFNTMECDDDFKDIYYLNKAMFELYKRNEGIAGDYLAQALDAVPDGLREDTQDDWWRFGGTVLKLGYGKWLTTALSDKGFDTKLAPYYAALVALQQKNIQASLNTVAVEIREPASKLVDTMKKYM